MKIIKNNTASFDVDAQKGFTPLCPDELPVQGGDEIAGELNKQATFARVRLGSKDAHNPNAVWVATSDKPQFSKVGLANSDIRWNSHCNVGTKGFELLDDLPSPIDYDYFVWKGIENDVHPYGVCFHDLAETKSTGVIEWLQKNSITTVIVGGIATDYCVSTSAKQLVRNGFEVVVNLSACRGIATDSINRAIAQMGSLGIVIIKSLNEVEVI